MNYTLELNIPGNDPNILFNTIMLDSFKVNIVERYMMKAANKVKLCEVLFKMRTLDDHIINKKDGNINTYFRGDEFKKYQNLKKVLSSYQYRKNLINRKEAEHDFVHFILSIAISNYELN